MHIATEVARGLAHAHAEGVIHRDLKPANVFVTNKGQVKILDFGMAHAFGRRRLSGGTPAYMAPEQWEDDPEDERTDVFALGRDALPDADRGVPVPGGGGEVVVGAGDGAGSSTCPVRPSSPSWSRRCSTGRPRGARATARRCWRRSRPSRTGSGRSRRTARRRCTRSGGRRRFGDLLAELKRRHVFRVMIGYGVFAFAVLQVTEPIMHGAAPAGLGAHGRARRRSSWASRSR